MPKILCKYAVVGCPLKRCTRAHVLEEFYPERCSKLCSDIDCDLLHPSEKRKEHFERLLKKVIQHSGKCPYGKDCPKIYCPYDRDKYSLDWEDESPPDFSQKLLWKPL